MKRSVTTALGVVLGVGVVALIIALFVSGGDGSDRTTAADQTKIGVLVSQAKIDAARRSYTPKLTIKDPCKLRLGVLGDRQLPGSLCGRETTFEVVGSVPFEVDLEQNKVEVGSNGRVTVHLPPAAPGKNSIDSIDLLSEDTGLVTKVGGLFKSDPDLYDAVAKQANKQMMDVARGDTEARLKAQAKVRSALENILRKSGVSNPKVEFDLGESSRPSP